MFAADHAAGPAVGLDEQHVRAHRATAPPGPTAPEPAYRSSTAAPASPPRIAVTVANSPPWPGRWSAAWSGRRTVASRRPPAVPAMIRVTGGSRAWRWAWAGHAFSRNVGLLAVDQRPARPRPGQAGRPAPDRHRPALSLPPVPGRSGPRPAAAAAASGSTYGRPARCPARHPRGAAQGQSGTARNRQRCSATASSRSRAGAASGASVTSRHRPAIATATDPPAQLVQLGDAEPVGVHDHHHDRVRHVHADLDDGGGDQHVHQPVCERQHHLVLLVRRQPAMQDGEPQPGQRSAAPARPPGRAPRSAAAPAPSSVIGEAVIAVRAASWSRPAAAQSVADPRADHVRLAAAGRLFPDPLPGPGPGSAASRQPAPRAC